MTADHDHTRQTWDGEPISPTPPYGATVVVYRRTNDRPEFLILHRHHQGPDFAGDWAWGPPSGARYPAEPIATCAARELREETGLTLPLRLTSAGSPEWTVYLAEAPPAADIALSPEHDRFAWLPLAAVAARIAPDVVRDQVHAAAQLVQAGERYHPHL